MNFDFDVIVVGAGPVGSTIAYYLSEDGLNVSLIEKKKEIGYPLQCAGILSKHIFDYNTLPEEVILNEVKGAFLHSNEHILNVEKEYDVAYIIDRIAYDKYLFERAIDSNVNFINQKAINYDIKNGIVHLSNNQKINGKVIVGCDGYNSLLSKHFNNTQSNFTASQMLVEIEDEDIKSFRKSNKNVNYYVDTYLFEDILPGFLWIIPLNNNQYRIGLFSNDSHKTQNEFINNFLSNNFDFKIIEKYKGFIPIFNEKNQIVKDRAILIGDAASQIKPTSGGGLLMGFDACKISYKYIIDSIKEDDINILEGYQKEFNKKYLKEINYQFKVQKTLNLLSNDDINYLFLKLKENNCEKLISDFGDMDTQSTLVKEFIKKGLLFKFVPNFLFKKVTKIFNFR